MAAILRLKFVGGMPVTTAQARGRFAVGVVSSDRKFVTIVRRTDSAVVLLRALRSTLANRTADGNGPWSGRTTGDGCVSVIDTHRGSRVIHLGAVLAGADPATTTAVRIVGGRPRPAV